MDELLNKAITAAKIVGKKDPDRKSKEVFIRLFKDDSFRYRFKLWAKENGKAMRINSFFNRKKVFLSWAHARGHVEVPQELRGGLADNCAFIGSAIYQFAIFGEVFEWPMFGCRLKKLPPTEDTSEAAIVVHPEASLGDVIRFAKKNWKLIKAVATNYGLSERFKLGKVVPKNSHLLNSIIYEIKQENPKFNESQILNLLKKSGINFSSQDKLGYIRQALNREGKLRKGKKIPKSQLWK